MLLLAGLIVGFVLGSGFFSLIEAAILSVTRAEAAVQAQQERWGAADLIKIQQRLPQAVAVLVVLTNTVNVLGPILVGQQAIELFDSSSIGVITAVLTLSTIIFSEVIPKSLGALHAPTIARLSAPGLRLLIAGLYPVVWLLERIANAVRRGQRRVGTEEQIRALVRIGHQAGHIRTEEQHLIQQAFLLNDRTAADIMTPAASIISLPETTSMIDAAKTVFASTHSRYPIRGVDQQITGMIISHDVLGEIAHGRADAPISTISRPVLLVDPDMQCNELLLRFRGRRQHLAIVQTDDAVQGLLTLEDVLEELVGEISDEKEKA